MKNNSLLRNVNWGGVKSLVRFLVPMIMALMAITATAQTHTVSGTITGDDGEPIIGASVMVKGTQIGAATNLDGFYRIERIAPTATLEISYVGYTTQQVPIDGRSVVDVVLKENRELLDEVVVIGYGTVKRKDLTGAVYALPICQRKQLQR